MNKQPSIVINDPCIYWNEENNMSSDQVSIAPRIEYEFINTEADIEAGILNVTVKIPLPVEFIKLDVKIPSLNANTNDVHISTASDCTMIVDDPTLEPKIIDLVKIHYPRLLAETIIGEPKQEQITPIDVFLAKNSTKVVQPKLHPIHESTDDLQEVSDLYGSSSR